jgi:Holliday junction DNA helicase RuvB
MRDFAQVFEDCGAAGKNAADGPATEKAADSAEKATLGDTIPRRASRITRAVVEKGLKRLEIDSLGLERHDREILKIIIERYNGGPVGAETLAISVGEAVDTLEDYYEPYLIQAGLLQRTPRGRIVTTLGYRHMGFQKPASLPGEAFLF